MNSQIENQIVTQVHTQKTDLIDPIVWKQMQGMAERFVKSGAMPQHLKNAEQILVVMQAGYEMGMKPMEAINGLYIVNGVVTVWGKTITSRFRRYGYDLNYENETQQSCTVIAKKDGREYRETFSFEDAVKSGYTKDRTGSLKFGWKEGENRKLKLRYGALNSLSKTKCAEVLGTAVGITEVYRDVEVVDGQVNEVESNTQEVAMEDINTINNTMDNKKLTKLFSEMLKKYHVRTIKPLFEDQKNKIKEMNNENL